MALTSLAGACQDAADSTASTSDQRRRLIPRASIAERLEDEPAEQSDPQEGPKWPGEWLLVGEAPGLLGQALDFEGHAVEVLAGRDCRGPGLVELIGERLRPAGDLAERLGCWGERPDAEDLDVQGGRGVQAGVGELAGDVAAAERRRAGAVDGIRGVGG